MKIIIPIGPSGAGKSYLHDNFFSSTIKISSDDNVPNKDMYKYLDNIMMYGDDVYFDTNNLIRYRRKKLYDYARIYKYDVILIWMDITKNKCIKQNFMRDNSVSKKIIIKQFKNWQGLNLHEINNASEIYIYSNKYNNLVRIL